MTVLAVEPVVTHLKLLHALIPNAVQFGVLVDPAFPATPSIIADLQVKARSLGLQLVIASATTDRDLVPAFTALSQQRVGAVLGGVGNVYSRFREKLAALAVRHALPAIFPYSEYARAGGLMSYAVASIMRPTKLASIPDAFSRVRSPPTCRSSRRRNSNSSSISRPPRRSASPSRKG
jgi:putative ABC transport system substrate-binding protein